MGWINEPLNTFQQPNYEYFGKLWDKGIFLADQVLVATNKIATESIPALNFAGTTPDLITPATAGITLPTAPIKPIIVNAVVGGDPAPPTLTTVATNELLSELITEIKNSLYRRLTYATGLLPHVEAAIFGRGVDRETKIHSSGFANYMAAQSAMGWASPSGQDRAAFIVFETKKQGALSDLSRDIMIKQAELEQSNMQKSIDKQHIHELMYLIFFFFLLLV